MKSILKNICIPLYWNIVCEVETIDKHYIIQKSFKFHIMLFIIYI